MNYVHRLRLTAGLLTTASIVFCCILIGTAPATGAGGPLQDEILASQSGEYTKTINIGQQLVASYPNNDLAHYYLADAYYHTNQLRQAEEEYRQCLRVTQNKTLQSYCQEFLNRVHNISLDGIAAPNSIPIKMDEVSKLHEQMHQEEARESSEETAIITRLRQDADMRIKKIQDQLREDLSNIPEVAVDPDAPVGRQYGRFIRSDMNATTKLNSEAERATQMVQRKLESDIMHVRSSYQAHDAAIANFSHGINSQLKPGVSEIQLTPHNLGLNVKNYENFAPSSTPAISAPPVVEMRATPGVLRAQ